MGHAQEAAPLNRQAYLEWEAAQPDKHEYIAGEVFAMVGVRRGHALAALTIASRLREHLKGSRCDTFVSDMKLFVADADAYFYPDVMVTCDERDRRAELAIEHPKLVVEVLSDPPPPTTAAPSLPPTASSPTCRSTSSWTSPSAASSSTAARPTTG